MAVHSVSEITRYIKNMFDMEPVLQNVMIRGEISNFKQYSSGHCYFTLKDVSSSLKCVMFRSRAQNLRFRPVNGLKIVAAGNISVYDRDGAYQLYVERLMPEGAGELSLAFEQLKARLDAEGLFADAHKKKLPAFPETIGVVTSVSGAVLRDIYHVSKRRNPSVRLVLYPVQVQGDGAAGQIAHAVRFFNRKYPVDVLIIGRGGGSMEDLWAFNEEVVVRAVYDSKIPVISAVGHETDYTLADFVGDVRAATPSQAAELAVPDTSELNRYVAALMARLQGQMQGMLRERRQQLLSCLERMRSKSPVQLLAGRRQRVDTASGSLQQLMQTALLQRRHQVEVQAGKLEMLSPMQVLLRGYGIVASGDQCLRSVRGLSPGERVHITLADGGFQACVEHVDEEEDR